MPIIPVDLAYCRYGDIGIVVLEVVNDGNQMLVRADSALGDATAERLSEYFDGFAR